MRWVLAWASVALAIVAALGAESAGGAGGRRSAPVRVAVYLTTADLHSTLRREPDAVFHPGAGSGADNVVVNPATRYQRLTTGFGVAMTDTSAYLLAKRLPARTRAEVMGKLFARVGGIGLSFLRVPVGGSDYVIGPPYTYDDVAPGQSDPALAHFSLAHDSAYVIPMIRQALSRNPQMSIMANPWTPPAWMKTDDKLITTTGPAGQLYPQYYGAYAQYLVKFLQGYQRSGIRVNYLGVQNEPLTPLLFVSGIPESYLSPQDEGNLIHNYVAPALRRAGLGQKVLAYDDHFQTDLTYVPPVMAAARADVSGIAYHCYLSDPSSMSTIHAQYPEQMLLETECSSYLSNIEPAQMAIRVLRNGAQGVQLWNAAVDQHYGPKIGNGCMGITGPHAGKDCIAPVIINTTTHRYSLTSDYWALAQFSKLIQLGARRIDSTTPSSCPTSPESGWSCGLEDVAFQNPDGRRVLVATAHDGQPHRLTVTEGSSSFSYTIPDGATATFVWSAPRPVLSHVRIRHRRLRFVLSEDARAVVRVGRRWVLRVSGREGSNAIRLPRLGRGRHRVRIVAVDAGGDRSKVVRRMLRVRG